MNPSLIIVLLTAIFAGLGSSEPLLFAQSTSIKSENDWKDFLYEWLTPEAHPSPPADRQGTLLVTIPGEDGIEVHIENIRHQNGAFLVENVRIEGSNQTFMSKVPEQNTEFAMSTDFTMGIGYPVHDDAEKTVPKAQFILRAKTNNQLQYGEEEEVDEERSGEEESYVYELKFTIGFKDKSLFITMDYPHRPSDEHSETYITEQAIVVHGQVKFPKTKMTVTETEWEPTWNLLTNQRPGTFTFQSYDYGVQLEINTAPITKSKVRTIHYAAEFQTEVATFDVPSYSISMIGNVEDPHNILRYDNFIGCDQKDRKAQIKCQHPPIPVKVEIGDGNAAQMTVEYPIPTGRGRGAKFVFGPKIRPKHDYDRRWRIIIIMTFDLQVGTTIHMGQVELLSNPKLDAKDEMNTVAVEAKSRS